MTHYRLNHESVTGSETARRLTAPVRHASSPSESEQLDETCRPWPGSLGRPRPGQRMGLLQQRPLDDSPCPARARCWCWPCLELLDSGPLAGALGCFATASSRLVSRLVSRLARLASGWDNLPVSRRALASGMSGTQAVSAARQRRNHACCSAYHGGRQTDRHTDRRPQSEAAVMRRRKTETFVAHAGERGRLRRRILRPQRLVGSFV